MATRGVWQMKSLVLRFSNTGGSSAGMRSYIRSQLQAFAAANPDVEVQVLHSVGKHPIAVGTYRDGTAKQIDLRNKDADSIVRVVQQLRDVATGRVRKFNKSPVHSLVPSVQGIWDPSTTYEGFELRPAKAPSAAAGAASSAAAAASQAAAAAAPAAAVPLA